MSKAKSNLITTIIKMLLKALLWAILLTLVAGYFLGYNLILVNGRSAQPLIQKESLIITSKFKLKDLNVGEFITYSYSGKNYITHQIIAVNKDGRFFEEGEMVPVVIDGGNYTLQYGKKLDEAGQVAQEGDTIIDNCNIMVIQRTYNSDGSFNLDARIEYLNYNKNFVGKVIYTNYTIGKTIFTLKDNLFITVGMVGCFVLLLVWKEQLSTESQYD